MYQRVESTVIKHRKGLRGCDTNSYHITNHRPIISLAEYELDAEIKEYIMFSSIKMGYKQVKSSCHSFLGMNQCLQVNSAIRPRLVPRSYQVEFPPYQLLLVHTLSTNQNHLCIYHRKAIKHIQTKQILGSCSNIQGTQTGM